MQVRGGPCAHVLLLRHAPVRAQHVLRAGRAVHHGLRALPGHCSTKDSLMKIRNERTFARNSKLTGCENSGSSRNQF